LSAAAFLNRVVEDPCSVVCWRPSAHKAGRITNDVSTLVANASVGAGAAAEESYEVHFLIGRHGLSCTNVVEKWVHKWDAGRGRILDPFLAGAGESGSRESGERVEAWLSEKGFTLDAVLASELLRAQETALLTYSRYFEQEGTLYVMPYVREDASGPSNSAKEQADQVADLAKVAPGGFHMNYEWVHLLPQTKPNWPEFLKVMERGFLPDLLRRLGKQPRDRIVIALATHSLFMRDSEVGKECKSLFGPVGDEGKPQNNQVVHLEYKLRAAARSEHDGGDVTPNWKLFRSMGTTCEEVAHGSSTKPCPTCEVRADLCLGDIGQHCFGPIKDYAWGQGWLWGRTVEREIVELAKTLAGYIEKKSQLTLEVTAVARRRELEGNTSFDINDDWGGMGWLGRSQRTQAEWEADMSEVKALFYTKHRELAKLMAFQCWAGGKPNPLQYVELVGEDLSENVKGFLAEGSDGR